MDGDPRFGHVAHDPRFKSVPRHTRKVKIDSRFRSMFSDKNFKVKYLVDRRGKRVGHTSTEDLRKYYQLDEGEVPEGEDGGARKEVEGVRSNGYLEEEERETANAVDIRGESSSASDSEGEEESSSTDSEDDLFPDKQGEQIVHPWGGEEEEEEGVGESDVTSSRLAVCNIDWDRITAQDLYALINSFKPSGGLVHSVAVYPSDFGMERMRREEVEGPGDSLGGGEEGEGGGYSQERLRQYQLSRLKYFYAVVTCDSRATAEHIYGQCDGLEYEHSGGRIDLRFIPDGMTFEDREPKSMTSDVPTGFKPSEFFTSALQQSKVNLTWDETDARRLQTTMKKFTNDDLLSMDFNAYLASSSEDEEEMGGGEGGEEDQIRKYKALLEGGEGEGGEGKEEELEITWEPGLREKAEDVVKKKKAKQEQGQLTPWEAYLVRKRERRKEKKKGVELVKEEEGGKDLGFDDPFFQHDVTMTTARSKRKGRQRKEEGEEDEERGQLELLVMEDSEEKEHFSLKKIMEGEKEHSLKGKKKRKKRTEAEVSAPDTFEVDVHDPRFSALYESHLYAPDPSHPHYRPTKAMATLMQEKQKRRREGHSLGVVSIKSNRGETPISNPSVASLVKSVKAKSNSFTEHRKKLGAKRLKT